MVSRALERLAEPGAGVPVTPGTRREWNFSEIDATSFLWQERESGGGAWRVTHEIRALRA